MDRDRLIKLKHNLEIREAVGYIESIIMSAWFTGMLITEKAPWFIEAIPEEKRPYVLVGVGLLVATTGSAAIHASLKLNIVQNEIDHS